MNWTDEQKEAIQDRDNSLLVSAAAGSGKTAVLIERIYSILTEGAETPEKSLDRMLIVTFTKAAAAEMREKLRKKLNDSLKDEKDEEKIRFIKKQLSLLGRADICTFDSFCQKLIRSYYHIVDADPGLKVCDEYKRVTLINEAMDELFTELYEKKDSGFLDFLDHYSSAKSDENARQLIKSLYEFTDTLADPDKDYLNSPMFKPAELENIAEGYALGALKSARSYCSMLMELFEENKLPRHLQKVSEVWSEMDSMISQCESGRVRDAIERMISFEFGNMPKPTAEEKDRKVAIDTEIKAYWNGGVRDTINNFRKGFGEATEKRLGEEYDRIRPYVEELCRLTVEFRKKFSEKKKKAGFIDFSDGEHKAVEILKNDAVKEECRRKYRYVFVDEYQDCNPVQEAIIEAVSSEDNLFTVGDVKQSIYRFRHAEPGLFQARKDLYASPDKGKCKVIYLSSNFRSDPPVIDFVNRLFRRLMTDESCGMEYGKSEELNRGTDYEIPENCLYEPEIDIVETQDYEEVDDAISELKNTELEALNAVDIIKRYHNKPIYAQDVNDKDKMSERPLEYRDMVILLRAAKGKDEIFYNILNQHKIPVYLDRNEGYFDTPEIQVLVNLLRIIDNPRQDVPLISVLYFPSFGFTAEELAKIRIEGKRSGKHKMSYYDAFRYVIEKNDSALSSKCRVFDERLASWRTKADAMPLADFIWDLMSESGIFVFAASMSYGKQRTANLRALVDKASEFEKNDSGGIFGFISYVDILSDEKTKIKTGQSSVASPEDDVVRIMTIHKSKGLQFPFVLLASCSDDLGRGGDKLRAVFHRKLKTSMYLTNTVSRTHTVPLSFSIIKSEQNREELAEKLRVLYVASTRAEHIFVMSCFAKDPQALKDSVELFAIKGADCSSYAQMALPEFRPGRINIVAKKDLSLKGIKEAAENEAELREKLKNGFDIDEKKFAKEKKEIEERLAFDYSAPAEENQKKKYSVSELAASERAKEGKEGYEFRKSFPVPAFMAGKVKLSAAAVGTAYHKVMEHIDFNLDASNPGYVASFMEGLKEKGILSEDEFAAVRPQRIAAFFSSELGRRVCSADKVRKETPFVIKHGLDGRTVLVQGTIDCWFEEGEKLCLLDYKSNYVDLSEKESELERLKDEYRPQLKLYKEALENILKRTVEESYLYLFSAGEYISLGD